MRRFTIFYVGLLFFGLASKVSADVVVTDPDDHSVIYRNFNSTSDFTADHYHPGGFLDALDSDHWFMWVEVLSISEPPEVSQLFHLNALNHQQLTPSSIGWNVNLLGHQFDLALNYGLVGSELTSGFSLTHTSDANLPEPFRTATVKIFNIFDYDAVAGIDQLAVATNQFTFTDSLEPDYLATRTALTSVERMATNVDWQSFMGADLENGPNQTDKSAAFQWDFFMDHNQSFSINSGSFVAVPEPSQSFALLAVVSGLLTIRRRM